MNGTAHRRKQGYGSQGASATGRVFFVCPTGGRSGAASRGRETGARGHTRRAADRELAQQYRSLVEQMQVGIAILRVRPLRFLFANRAFARMSGYRARELTSLGPKEAVRRFHPEDRAIVLDYLGKRIAGRKAPLLNACRIVRKDGAICHAEISSRRMRYEGRPAVQAAFIDRTRRLANERRLHLLSQAVEQVAEGVAVLDLHGRIVYANPAVAAMHGRTPRSLVGKLPVAYHTPEQMAAVRAALAQTMSMGHFSGELWHARRDGTAFPCLVQTTVLRDEKGGEIGFVATCRDITDAKNAADEIARSREEKTLILDSVSESIAYKDKRFRIVWANWAAARRAGMNPRELLGRRCHEVWYGRARPCPRCPALVAIRTGKPAWGESAVGNGRRHLIGVFPVRDSEGRISGSVEVAIEAGGATRSEELHDLRSFSKMLIDIQEEERRRMALELHDQVGQRLTALRFHLRRIGKRCAEVECATPVEFAEAYSLIDAAVGDVRAISRRLRPPTLDILGLVPSLSQLVESLSLQSGIPVRLSSQHIRGKMDARIEIALYRVAQEALTNALRYSGCTRIDIFLRKIRRTLTLRIVDDGKGFAPLRANRVTGLGLTGMRERIEGVGGSFAVRSVPAAGTRIEARVPLPLCAPRARRKGGGG